MIACLSPPYLTVGGNQSSPTASSASVKEDSTHDRMAGHTRGSVHGWCKACFDGERKTHTESLGGMAPESARRLSEVLHKHATK